MRSRSRWCSLRGGDGGSGMRRPRLRRGVAGPGSQRFAVHAAGSLWRAMTRSTAASGAGRTLACPSGLDEDEADLAGLGLLVDAHQLQPALGAAAPAPAPAGRRARAAPTGGRRNPPPPDPVRPTAPRPAPCRRPPPRRAAIRHNPGRPRWRGRRCGRSSGWRAGRSRARPGPTTCGLDLAAALHRMGQRIAVACQQRRRCSSPSSRGRPCRRSART